MSDIKSVLREMVLRVSKKQVNASVKPLVSKVKELRLSVHRQKKLITELQKKVARFSILTEPQSKLKAVSADELKITRLSPAWIAALRRKLKLSGQEFGKILGINTQTVYRWESGKSKPMKKQRAKIIALRSIGKREVKELLAGKKTT